jgi:sugar (pentulose or hexulose) kinase
MTLTLGVDIGTSGVRTAVLDGDRAVLSMARAEHPPQTGPGIDANDWWRAVEHCLTNQMQALRALGHDPGQITAISVDGTSGSMVVTDANLAPTSPGLMYNSKGFRAEAARIDAHAPDTHITKGSNSALARALRLVATSRTKPAHLLHQADFIAAKLAGRVGGSDFNNALKTGFDPETETWPDWIGEVIPPEILPQVHAPGTAVQPMSDAIARQFGMSTAAMVHAGTTDSIAAFLAAAPLDEGVAVTSLGSTLAIKLLSSIRVDDPAVGLYSHRLGDLWLAGGASNTGGAVLKSFFTAEDLTKLSQRIDPDHPQNLGYYPLLTQGERFPINDPDLHPRMTPRPDDDAAFLQALFEGMAMIERDCYAEIARKGGPHPSKIITAGGGAQNSAWARIRARTLGIKPVAADQTEAAIGVAKLAAG